MDTNWERDTIEKILLSTVVEQRRARRWRIFFRILWIVLIISAVCIFSNVGESLESEKKHVAVVDLKGVIGDETKTYDTLIKGITKALKNENTVGVIIRANSPGGSPVYSNMVYMEILRLRKEYPNKPINVVVEEVCASGCYYIAAAADKIYANSSSIIGSIGVIYAGFGATGLMDKVGVDSRLLIAGKNKAMGYPFIPANKEQESLQQQMLNEVHQQFIGAVKAGRGARLHDTQSAELFSGRYWLGADGMALGLIDGLASVDSLVRDQFKTENIVDYTPDEDVLDSLSKKIGVGLVDSAKQSISYSNFVSFK